MKPICIFLLLFSGTSLCVCAQEPAWWTSQKKDCSLPPSLAYNTWVAQGMPCNNTKPLTDTTAGHSSYDDPETKRKKEEAEQKLKEEAETNRKKEEAERIERENKKTLDRMKGTASKDLGLKTTASGIEGLKSETNTGFGLKNTSRDESYDKQIKDEFLKTVREDSIHYISQLQKLMTEADHIYVPSPAKSKIIHEGIILGLFNTQEKNAVKHITSPFTGKQYRDDEFFATSDSVSATELLRGVADNGYLGEWTLNTDWGKKLIAKLEGTHFDRLIAHSNGATVSEALILKGIITVDELNVVGGDRSLINYFGYNELIASGKVKRVIVWINPGDIIPYGSSAGLFSTPGGLNIQYIKTASGYFMRKLTGQNEGGDAHVEYRFLNGSQYEGQELKFGKDVFAAHGLDAYSLNMKTYFRNNN